MSNTFKKPSTFSNIPIGTEREECAAVLGRDELINVDVDFFDEEEMHTTNLKSIIAEIDEKTNFMTAIKNVVVVSDSGATLFTDTLRWDSKKEIIYTASPIMLTTEKNDTLYGSGFESDVGLNHWKILYPSGVTN